MTKPFYNIQPGDLVKVPGGEFLIKWRDSEGMIGVNYYRIYEDNSNTIRSLTGLNLVMTLDTLRYIISLTSEGGLYIPEVIIA